MARPEPAIRPKFFATPAAFRRWLERNHASADELWVGFHKKGSGKRSITWPESVDQALCFGWIDGVRKSLDQDSYVIRFTPRRAGSYWSAVNTRRAKELIAQGLMQDPGRKAFERRDAKKDAKYSFERENPEFDAALLAQFRANRRAWTFFEAQPPGYRKTVTWWVISAKRDATRQKRLETLIADCEAGRRIGLMQRPDRSD